MKHRAAGILLLAGGACASPAPRGSQAVVAPVVPVRGEPALATTPEAPPPVAIVDDDAGRRFLHGVPPPMSVRRHAEAVVFFVSTRSIFDDDGGDHEETRLVPIACMNKGRIVGGLPCMRTVPAETALWFTDGVTRKSARVARGVEECSAAGDPHGKTDVLFLADPLVQDHPMLAVWPADADVGFIAHRGVSIEPTDEERTQLDLDTPARYAKPSVMQSFESDLDGDGRIERVFGVVSGGPQPSERAEIDLIAGAKMTKLEAFGPRYQVVLATVDLANDRRRQLVVFQPWVNDHGLAVYDGAGKRLYGYGCGNI